MSREKKYICILLNQHKTTLQKVDCWLNCPLPGLVGNKMMSPTTEIILPNTRADNGIALDWLLSRQIDWKEGLPIINEKTHCNNLSWKSKPNITLWPKCYKVYTVCLTTREITLDSISASTTLGADAWCYLRCCSVWLRRPDRRYHVFAVIVGNSCFQI